MRTLRLRDVKHSVSERCECLGAVALQAAHQLSSSSSWEREPNSNTSHWFLPYGWRGLAGLPAVKLPEAVSVKIADPGKSPSPEQAGLCPALFPVCFCLLWGQTWGPAVGVLVGVALAAGSGWSRPCKVSSL